MPLFLGSKQVKLYLNNKKYLLTVATDVNTLLPDNVLISQDGYYLKDKNNVYLVYLDEEEELLLTADKKVVTTSTGQKIMVQKGG